MAKTAKFPDRRYGWPPVDEHGNLDRRVFALIQHTDRCMGRAPLMEFPRLLPPYAPEQSVLGVMTAADWSRRWAMCFALQGPCDCEHCRPVRGSLDVQDAKVDSAEDRREAARLLPPGSVVDNAPNYAPEQYVAATFTFTPTWTGYDPACDRCGGSGCSACTDDDGLPL